MREEDCNQIKVREATESLDDPTNASLHSFQDMFLFLKNFVKVLSLILFLIKIGFVSKRLVPTLTFLLKLSKLPILIRDERFGFLRFPF